MLDDIGQKLSLTLRKVEVVQVEEDLERGIARCRRDIFTDPDLFELEMKHIFEGNWISVTHESQVANRNDYYTTRT